MTDDESAAYEAEILRLWDELPDYAKTLNVLDKIKATCPASLMNKLEKRQRNMPLIIVDESEGEGD